MIEFKYNIGQDCWMIQRGYGHEVYRCVVLAKITYETEKGIELAYRVKLDDQPVAIDVEESSLFDVATRSHDAICAILELLRKPKM